MTSLQLSMTFKKSIWSCPSEYKNLSGYPEIAIDLETRDEGITKGLGAGWATNQWRSYRICCSRGWLARILPI
jgi:hypothetical protein